VDSENFTHIDLFQEKKSLTLYSELVLFRNKRPFLQEMAKNREKPVLSFDLRIFPQFKSV
jgi:hypothetical protein